MRAISAVYWRGGIQHSRYLIRAVSSHKSAHLFSEWSRRRIVQQTEHPRIIMAAVEPKLEEIPRAKDTEMAAPVAVATAVAVLVEDGLEGGGGLERIVLQRSLQRLHDRNGVVEER